MKTKRKDRAPKKASAKSVANCPPDGVVYQDVSKIHPALRGYLGYCLHKATTIFKSKMNEIFEAHDMQGHHFAILSVIATDSDVNQIKICDEIGIDKASMVKITDHLEKHRLIERVGSKEDRRVKNLHITSRGQKFLQMAKAKRAEIENSFLSALTEEEVKNFKSLLLKVLDSQKKVS